MYARKYYLLYIEEIFYLNIQEPVSNPSSFYVKSLLTFLPFAAYIIFIKFTSFTIHLVHHSLFHFHFFTFFSPFPFPFPSYLPHHSFLSTSQHPGQRLKKTGTTLSFLAKMY